MGSGEGSRRPKRGMMNYGDSISDGVSGSGISSESLTGSKWCLFDGERKEAFDQNLGDSWPLFSYLHPQTPIHLDNYSCI